MATNEEILNPKSLVLPVIPYALQSTAAPQGLIFISGAFLCFNTGSAVKIVTTA
jgi:hypothetical protein